MILTCPDCATRYFVDDTRLGPQGRRVRCAACGSSWRVEAESGVLELSAPAATPEAAPEPVARSPDALPQSFRAKVEAQRRTRRAVAAGVVWAGLAAGFAILLVSAAVFREQVVQIWPRTAGAYAAVRLPVNPLGLVPDGVQAAPGLENGHAALMVLGAERNIETGPRAPAPLRISLYDKAGHRLAQQVVRIDGEPIRPGESRAFRVSFLDPPLAGTQVGVDFVFEPRVRHRAAASDAPAMAAAGGPRLRARTAALPSAPHLAPSEARPLPAGSPYALPVAASGQAMFQAAGRTALPNG